jgi:hypothetical protein
MGSDPRNGEVFMSYAIIGFGKIGQALAKAFACNFRICPRLGGTPMLVSRSRNFPAHFHTSPNISL